MDNFNPINIINKFSREDAVNYLAGIFFIYGLEVPIDFPTALGYDLNVMIDKYKISPAEVKDRLAMLKVFI